MKPCQRAWYRFENKADDPAVAELFIFGDIGTSWWNDDAVSAKQFMDDLKGLSAAVTTIVVHVNSLGGDVFDGVAIANALRDQGRSKGRKVHTIVDGIAASAASIVIMAGETIQIADNALVMVHKAWTFGIGNAIDMRKLADTLDTIDSTIVATYKWHSSLSDEEIVALMVAETWMSADDAIANGFATEKVEGLKAAASLDGRTLATLKIPEKYRDRVAALVKPAPDPPAAPAATEVLRICREGQCLDLAEGLIAASASIEDVRTRVTDERTKRTQATERATQIRALCTQAKLTDRAEFYIKGAHSIDDIKADLTARTAERDRTEIDGGLLPDQGRHKAKLNAAEIYSARNRRAS